ncbi:MAG TPA: AbrB/MazE/SpoVT family DNA-binding domain-containing protein [Nitrosopumilaceae archaeon]|nr:AbrB/MazE/SpoVT family DNA-binding domain-containing protein [Nitrosopumilaceae archaeon]
MDLESTASTARTGTNSLRVTVPEGIVAFLGLDVGDKLQWIMDTDKTERVVIVKKKKAKRNG